MMYHRLIHMEASHACLCTASDRPLAAPPAPCSSSPPATPRCSPRDDRAQRLRPAHDRSTRPTSSSCPTKPPPPPPPPPPSPTPPRRAPASTIDTPPVIIPTPLPDPPPSPTARPVTGTDPLAGTAVDPQPDVVRRSAAPALVRTAARFATPADLVRPPYPRVEAADRAKSASLRLTLAIDARGRVTAVDAGRARPTRCSSTPRGATSCATGAISRRWRATPRSPRP